MYVGAWNADGSNVAAARVTDSTTASAPAVIARRTKSHRPRNASRPSAAAPATPTRITNPANRPAASSVFRSSSAATESTPRRSPSRSSSTSTSRSEARRCSGAPWVSARTRPSGGREMSVTLLPKSASSWTWNGPASTVVRANACRARAAPTSPTRIGPRIRPTRRARSIASDRSSGVADGGRLVSLVLGSERLRRGPTGNLPRWLWGRHFGAEGERSGPCPEQGPLRSLPGCVSPGVRPARTGSAAREARGHPGRLQVGLPGGRRLAGHLEQVPPHRLEPVGVGHPLVRSRGCPGARGRRAVRAPSRPRRRGSA